MQPIALRWLRDKTHKNIGVPYSTSGRYVYALIDGLGMRWRRWPIEGTEGAPEDILVLRSGMPDGIAVAAGDERLVIADGDDLVFMPVDSPDQLSRRAAHDNPVKRLAATAELVASVACSFQDTRIDVLKLWTAAGDPLGTIALPGHVAELAIAPDGHRVVVLGTAGERWELPLGVADWAATAARIAGRSLTDEEQRRYRIDAWRARASRNNPA